MRIQKNLGQRTGESYNFNFLKSISFESWRENIYHSQPKKDNIYNQ